MPAIVGKGYNCLFMLREGRVQAPMRGKSHYANSACIYFFQIADVTLAGEDNSRPQTSSSHDFWQGGHKDFILDL